MLGGAAGWQIGIKGAINDLNECTQMVKYAVEVLKLKLSGGVTYCCAGDALDEKKARAFSDNYKNLVDAFRGAVGNPSLPFVSAMTPLTEISARNPQLKSKSSSCCVACKRTSKYQGQHGWTFTRWACRFPAFI